MEWNNTEQMGVVNISLKKTIILYISYSHLDTTISYHDYDAEHQ